MTPKVWEETWEATESYEVDGKGYCNDVINGQSTEVFLRGGSPRFRLALAAPEMARLLLDVMWRGHDSDSLGDGVCVGCGVEEDGPHAPDCRLVAVLRKAGVLSESVEQKK